MRALALTWAYNEVDFLPWMISHALAQGVDVHVLDNWSTDGTYEMVRSMMEEMWAESPPVPRKTNGEISGHRLWIERWPASGATSTTSWISMLRYSEVLALQAREVGYDWVMHWDADELRESKQPDERLIDALARFAARGWNAVDHELVLYALQDGWPAGVPPKEWFTQIVPRHIDHSNGQLKCWRQPKWRVSLASTGGHRVFFKGMSIARERLVLRHYPLRTQEQAERKLREREERWAKSDRQKGFHVQYQPKFLNQIGYAK